MKTDKGKAKEQLIGELAEMRQRVAELESLEVEFKHAEEELRKFNTISENTVFGADIATPEGEYTYVNESFARMHGYTQDELVGIHWSSLFPEERLEFIRQQRDHLLKKGDTFTFEVERLRKDGSTFPSITTGAVVRDSKGSPMFTSGIIADITERKLAEEAILRFKIITDSAGYGIVIVDHERKITYVNESYAQMHGYKQDELIGKHISMVYPEEEQAHILSVVGKMAHGGRYKDEEIWQKRKDGTVFPTLMTGVTAIDDTGKLLLSTATVIDITEHKLVQEALRAAEQNFRNSLDDSPLGIRIVTFEGDLLYANQAILDIYGYRNLEELRNTPASQRYTRQSYAEYQTRKRKRQQGKPTPDDYEIDIVRKDGEIRHLSVFRKEVIWNGETQYQTLYQDITERKQVEEEYQTIVRTAMDGFWLLDMQGRFLDVNDAYCHLTGYSRDELLSMSIPDIEAREEPSETVEHILKIKEAGHDRFETHHRHKDGKIIDVEVSVNYLPTEKGRMFVFIRDITERRQAEEALAESQELYRAVMELGGRLGEAIVLLQDDERGTGMHVYMNDVWCDITGYSREELLDISMADLIHPKDRDAAVARYVRRLSGEDIPDLIEISIVRKNGTEVPVEITYAHSTYKGKSANVGFVREIAERKKAETALRQSEEFNSSVLRNSPNPVLVANSDTSIRYVNPALENLTGYSLDELVGQKMPRPWWPEEMYEKLKHEAKSAYRHGYKNVEQLLKKKNGERFWVQITATPVIIDGEFRHLIANWVDVTERKRMEEELIKNHGYLEKLTNSLTDIVFEIKFPERTIRYINKAVETVLGYRPEECLGQSIEMIYPSPEVFRELGRRLRQGIERGDEVTTSEHELKRKDGRIITVEGRTSYFREAGKVASALSVVRDITERKQAEEALQESEERFRSVAESANLAIVSADSHGNILLWNKTAETFFQYSADEAVGLSLTLIMPERFREAYKNGINRAASIGTLNAAGKKHEATGLRRDGSEFPIEISLAAWYMRGEIFFTGMITDITERKKAEAALTDEVTRRRILIEQSRDGIVILDQDGKVYESNQRFAEMLGYSVEEVSQLHVWDWEFQVPREQVLEMIRSVDEAGDHFETQHRRRDGTIYDVEISTNGAVFAGQKLIFCVVRDITERKQAEEEVTRFKTIASVAPYGVGIADSNSIMAYTNEAFALMHGYAPDEIVGQHYSILYTEEQLEAVEKLRKRCQETGNFVGEEVWRKRKDGTTFPSSLSMLQMKNDKGEPLYISAVVIDITERKRAEEALRENEQKLLRMFESVSEGITVTDLNGVIIEANAELARIHGLSSPSEMLGKSALDWIHPLEHDRALANFKKTMLVDGASGVVQYRLLKADGSDFPGELSTSVLKDASGTPGGFIATTRDITERRQLEEEQQRSARLESIGTLAGGIAHDFNNVLTGILGNISLAKRHVEPKSKADDRLLEAEKASLRARDLTQQLLTFSRGGTPVKKIVSIAELIPDSAGFALRGSNVSGQFSLPDGLWRVEADEGQMHQVITNLVINACEAMPEGGVLNISAENLVIKKKGVLPLPRGNYVAIAIEDHGVGISEGHLDRIYEPFFTTKQKGSGLGLATTYSIIRKHDGYIAVESTPTIGTTFRIYLPASDKPAPEQEEAVVETPLRGRGKILVMDDEEMIREMLNQMLPPAGYEVELTKDGVEAIERYRQAKESGHPFDAVIIDLTVPGGLGGRETIKKLLEIDAGVKAIVSSGYATDPVMANYKEYGFTDIVTKPYSVGDIEKILRSIINKERQAKGRKSK